MALTVKLKLPTLRKHQYQLYDAMERFNSWVCHRRFGKTILGLEVLLAKAASHRMTDPRYGYFAPTRVQAKDIAWIYLKRFTAQIPGIIKNEAELYVELPHNHARIQLYGADNHKLGSGRRGLYFDGVVIDEYADIAPIVWTQVIRPALSDRLGWAAFLGTPRGKNHFYMQHQRAKQRANWSWALLRADETQIIDPDELEDARLDMSEADFAQEYLCSWDSPMPGAVYAEQLRRLDEEGRIGRVPYNPTYPTYTAWDIGPVNTAIWWFQPIGDRFHFIDYEEGAGSLPHWIEMVRSKPYIYDQSKLSSPLTRSNYEVHYGPHDLEQTDFGTGKTRYTIALHPAAWPWDERRNITGLRFTVLPRGPLEDGIEAGRRLMDHAVFDEINCEEGLNGLRSYRYEWDDKKQTYRTIPVHDWASHPADGFRCAAVGVMPPRKPLVQGPKPGSFAHMRKVAIAAQKGRPIKQASFKVYS